MLRGETCHTNVKNAACVKRAQRLLHLQENANRNMQKVTQSSLLTMSSFTHHLLFPRYFAS